MKQVVIIGGNAAGMSAASRIKRLKPEWKVVVVEKGSFISYASCGIPYYLEGIVPGTEDLVALTPIQASGERGIDLKLNHEATAINPAEKWVAVCSPAGPMRLPYHFLVIATGAVPSAEGITVSGSEQVFSIKTLADAKTVQTFITEQRPRRCAVIGGGYIAVEMLEALKVRGVETHLIHRRKHLAQTFEPELSGIILKKMAREGIVINLETAVQAVSERNGQAVVETAAGEMLFDCAFVAVGVKPDTRLLNGTGITLGIKNAVHVNRHMQTSLDDIYAAGDCTETVHLVTGKPVYIPLALKANKEGAVAGANICGGKELFPGVAGTAITKFFDLGIARTGLTLAEAEEHGFHAVQAKISSPSRARYYPGGGSLETFLTVDRESGRLLGAQLAGPLDSVKRIDVYATALANQMTLEQIYNLDLAYAPPFSPVYDPVILAARVGRKSVRS